MSDHWVVFDDMSTGPSEEGIVEVAIDPPAGIWDVGPPVSYTVFDNGVTRRRDFTVNTNATGYATSGNLIAGMDHPPTLVRASILGHSWATMRHRDGAARALFTIPPSSKAVGRSFGIALGGVASSSHLLVGNPESIDAGVALHYGGSGVEAGSTTRTPAEGAVKISLTTGQCFLVVRSDSEVFVQLVIAGPERFDVSFVLPD